MKKNSKNLDNNSKLVYNNSKYLTGVLYAAI